MAFDRLSGTVGETDCVDELLPGSTLLLGQYRIARFLNSGGFGITYIARDGLGRDVVLKECFVEAFCSRKDSSVQSRSDNNRAHLTRALASFAEEARILASLSHPNIVRIHQLFEENNTAYMSLDFVAGHDLIEIVDEKKMTLGPDQIVGMAAKLISAVGHVHDNQLLHCDISPDNICVTHAGEPVLIDFGAARRVVDGVVQKHSGFTLVKDGYSPHELYATNGVCTRSSDLYALAASLYFAVSGRVPADSETRLRAMIDYRPDPLQPLAGSVPGYPPGFLASIDKAMSVEPASRFQAAEDWQRALIQPQVIRAETPRPAARPVVQPVGQPAAQPAVVVTSPPETRDRNVVLLRRVVLAPGQGRHAASGV
jgi:serine/threonine protein kinase